MSNIPEYTLLMPFQFQVHTSIKLALTHDKQFSSSNLNQNITLTQQHCVTSGTDAISLKQGFSQVPVYVLGSS